MALQIALRWPERVKSLTLYEPVRFALLFGNPATGNGGGSSSASADGSGWRCCRARCTRRRRFVDYWSGDGAWQALAPHEQRVLAHRMPKVQAEFEALFADRVPAAAYHALVMPVQLIGGSRSPLPARQVLEVLAAQMPHATRTTLSGVGHMGPVEAPQRILDALDALAQDVVIAQAA